MNYKAHDPNLLKHPCDRLESQSKFKLSRENFKLDEFAIIGGLLITPPYKRRFTDELFTGDLRPRFPSVNKVLICLYCPF